MMNYELLNCVSSFWSNKVP